VSETIRTQQPAIEAETIETDRRNAHTIACVSNRAGGDKSGNPTHNPSEHRWSLLAQFPAAPRASLLWLPALGVAAKHYGPFAEALAEHGIATFVHELRGHGSSSLRASRAENWGYRELLLDDVPASDAAMCDALPNVPRIFGGHSLGGQLAACHLALSHSTAHALWLVASGAPLWRTFPGPRSLALPLAYRFAPWLADRCGALPGRRIGFGGNEARGVIHDWARTGLSGRYAGDGIAQDLDTALAQVHARVQGVRLRDDWLVPQGSLDFLTGKMPNSRAAYCVIDRDTLGVRADHFGWMQRPQAVADALVSSLDTH
jgi:predicted alpha/beta hydrolase